MNAVIFYSNTGQSKTLATYFADALKYPLLDIETDCTKCYHNLVLVFPVYCQNIPDIVKSFLGKVSVTNLTLVATYGKMCCGNVLQEIQKRYNQNIVAAAYVPTKHSYITDDAYFCDYEKLTEIVQKIKNPSTITLPKLYKNPLANIFPKLRSRIGLTITKNANCTACDLCGKNCVCNAIHTGVTNKDCIRCLKCVTMCPHNALEIKVGFPLKLYLKKKKCNRTIIYV